jgi:acyl carrier protein
MAAPLANLTEIVRGVLHDADIELAIDTRFEDLPHWDSMRLIAVVVEVEFHFGLIFEPAEVETLHTVGDLLRMIAGKLALTSA